MSDRDLVIERCAELEQLLKSKGATGSGLIPQAISIEHLLSADLMKDLRWIARIRNDASHSVGAFHLRDRERYIQTCDSVKTRLSAINATAQSRHSTGSSRFSIASHLTTFNPSPLNLKLPPIGGRTIRFESFTGRVIEFKEKTEVTYREKGNSIKSLHQKIWLQLENGNEHFIELVNYSIQARKGHTLSIVAGRKGDQYVYVAVFIHELNRYFWNTDRWKSLIFPYHGCFTILVLLFVPGIIAWLVKRLIPALVPFESTIGSALTLYFLFDLAMRPVTMKRFRDHVGKIIDNAF